MIQLIVEDGGERRGFKVSEGVLTVGTSPDANLRLDAPDVAALHADLEVHGGVATLRPRPGVLRPEVGGTPVAGPIELRHDQPVVIGGARLTARYPDGAGPSAPGRPAVEASRPRVARRPERGRASSGTGAAQRARVRRRTQRGALVSLGVFAGVVALIAAFVFFVGPKFMGSESKEFEPAARMAAARREAGRGNDAAALAELDAIPSEVLTPAIAAQVAVVRGEIEARVAARARDVHNTAGNAWWREHLDKYEKFLLRGTPEPGAVRLFLERLAYFEQNWPEHPELPWVRRMQERYAEVDSLDRPPTYADLAFKVRLLTAESDPKDWQGAFAAIDEFVRRAAGSDRARAIELRDQTLAERQQWFDDRLQQARLDYEQDRVGQSFAWLVRIVVYVGDAGMAEQAAAQLVRFPDLSERLNGYRTHEPAEFAKLAAHPTIARFLADRRD